MSKQWGHGYHKGIEAAQANNGTLAGLWFHSRKDGKIEWQGHVARDLENGNYVVQLFEWGMGTPTVQKVIPFDQMKEWDFYPTDRAMRYAWNKHEGGSKEKMQAILDNIDAGVKAGLEKARKANTVEPFVGFDIGDVCEMPDGRIGLVTGYHSDDRNVWVTPWDETKEIKFGWDEIAEHWKKPNARNELSEISSIDLLDSKIEKETRI